MEQAKHPIQIVGDSNALKQVIDNSRKVAKTNANIFISGESGTGKELIANLIHAESARGSGPFIKVNCSAIPENLVESELFGFERGAFTGALTTKKGLFELAHRGTIFLDEVADLSLQAQAKILRVLQSGEILKLGSEKILKVDVRILSGTHKELKKAVQEGLFREDLFYRLNVVPLNIPSLRDRKEDIPLLIQFFSQQICAKNNFRMKPIDDDVLEELQRYPWPGNVRELQNVMERLLILSGPRVTLADLPEELQATNDDVPTPMNSSNSKILLKDFRDTAEREFVINTLKRNNGNISQSALELGVGRTYLHKRLSVLGIEKKDFLT
jgi:DNA-binding NtrC family response regulator